MKLLLVLSTTLLAACASEPTKPYSSLGSIESTGKSVAVVASSPGPTPSTKELGDPKNTVVHPAPVMPKFLSADHYESVSKSVAAFPAPNTIEQRADELNLITLQQMRTRGECARAATEVKVNLANLYGEFLTSAQIEKLAPFFDQVRNDADYFIYKLKTERNRKRPYAYITGLEPCVAREITPAYPSGHATISRLYALILSDMYPTKTKDLLRKSDLIASDRVLAGMHHRTDIVAGQALGERLYKEFSKSRDFRKELNDFERESQKVAR